MTLLAISPHLDDAAFSAGGALATWAAVGHRVVVATVFTRSVPDPVGFALACQTDKGVAPDADYLALRRVEDAAACAHLGAEPVWLDLEEAPHRGYDSPDALFGRVLPGDCDTWKAVRDRVLEVVDEVRPDLVLSCQGLGGHVDHAHVVQAVAGLEGGGGAPVAWWRDTPYAIRGAGRPAPDLPSDLEDVAVPLEDDALGAKLDACVAYATQIGYQFARDAPEGSSKDVTRRRIRAFATAEGRRFGLPAAEAFAVRLGTRLPPARS
ncbi:PIG-L deacetylase family protein [Rubrivirga sp.]|uniref:PIG-L deacetylase family protein n=1 Tax=Rubrivirga sp. TaxID=1885344 RepID=UPI003C72280B